MIPSAPMFEFDSNPYTISGSVWEAFEKELIEMDITFPQVQGTRNLYFPCRVGAGSFKHFFFLHHKGDFVIYGDEKRFKSPRELLDYFKSPAFLPENILAKIEQEAEVPNQTQYPIRNIFPADFFKWQGYRKKVMYWNMARYWG